MYSLQSCTDGCVFHDGKSTFAGLRTSRLYQSRLTEKQYADAGNFTVLPCLSGTRALDRVRTTLILRTIFN
ncbi:hypothetical protein NSPZN2_150031 [Nitrospira defluvii]|uniref:Uncharacterized protein n=1 Tax=Nitrospira defluvii TaxID=330214 RepID=A0ABM8RAM1_9BACT|nr:hypothetical protein NSPZN2_150031 [Nitrospira defluvii]